MKIVPVKGRTLALFFVIVPLLVLFVYVAFRSGPLAPVPVMVAPVEERSIAPGLYGIGNIESRYTYIVSPTSTGRIKRLTVHVGDRVKAGQLLGEMDPVDFSDRIRSVDAVVNRTAKQLQEAQIRLAYAQTQAGRYEKLLKTQSTTEESVATRRYEVQLAEIGLQTTREELTRSRAERDALHAQYSNLKLISPADGLVVLRDAEPGSTIMSGQRIIELIDPKNLWVNAHFDQVSSFGLKTGLAARIVLRSRVDDVLNGHVMRVEPKADTVTEEILAKVEFEQIPEPLPPVGELAEITVFLPNLPAEPVVPNASIQRIDGRMGVWQIVNDKLRYTPIVLGAGDLDGYVQVKEGLKIGDRIVVYSAKALTARSRIRSVDSIDGRVR